MISQIIQVGKADSTSGLKTDGTPSNHTDGTKAVTAGDQFGIGRLTKKK